MIQRLRKIWAVLYRREKINLFILFILNVLAGLLQAFSVISIFPFIAIVANQNLIRENALLRNVYEYFEFESNTQFLIFTGVAVFLFICFVNLHQAFLLYRQKRFIRVFLVDLTSDLLKLYLHQPYLFFVKSNSSHLSKKVIEDARYLAEKYFTTLFDFFSGLFVSIFLLAVLIYTDPVLSVMVLGMFVLLYGLVHFFTRKRLNYEGKSKIKAQKGFFLHLAETFGAIKDIKVTGNEGIFLDVYRRLISKFSYSLYYIALLVKIPPLIMDIITYGSIIFVVLYLLSNGSDLTEIIPVLVMFALAAQRLKPQVQLIFSSFSQMNFLGSSVDNVIEDITILKMPGKKKASDTKNIPRNFTHISIQDLCFRYPESSGNVIDKLNLEIKANTTVAFVGSSGSGKTTLIDLILGILQNQEGQILIDKIPLNEHSIDSWQMNIGYIPQHIFLFDESIARNIAFGAKDEEVDLDKVNRVLEMVDMKEFISQLPEGVHTRVGDKGVKLSGGQRQRIGIARALYREPSLLVMDEATSALDTITEEKVMQSIYRLAGKLTILIIAHRLTTVKECDHIHLMKKGSVHLSGKYSELLEQSKEFRAMAKEKSLA